MSKILVALYMALLPGSGHHQQRPTFGGGGQRHKNQHAGNYDAIHVIALIIISIALLTIASSVTTPQELAQQMTQEQMSQSSTMLPVVSLIITLMLAYLTLRASWQSWKLAGTLFLIFYMLVGCLPFEEMEQQRASTQIAETIANILTQTALSSPTVTLTPFSPSSPTPTLSPIPTSTASDTPTPIPVPCDRARFLSDVTIPDGTLLDPETSFTKIWRLQNIGSCSWTTSYALVFYSGDLMDGPTVVSLPHNVNPGDTIDLSVRLTTPRRAGTYQGNWMLRDSNGVLFSAGASASQPIWTRIVVSREAFFAVTSVVTSVDSFSYTGVCQATLTFSAKIYTNGAGTVTYYWVRSDGSKSAEQTLTYTAAGRQTVTDTWSIGSPGAVINGWDKVYINVPNHQNFGPITFSLSCYSPTSTQTGIPTNLPTKTLPPMPTETVRPTPTATDTTNPTLTKTPTATATPLQTPTPSETVKPTEALSPTPTAKPTLRLCNPYPTGGILPSRDSWVNRARPEATHGTDPQLHISPSRNVNHWALIQFDLNSIPTGSKITSAILYINNETGDNYQVELRRVTGLWDESATWKTRPTFDSNAIGDLTITKRGCVRAGYIDPTVVQVWLDSPSTNYGLALYPPSGTGDVKLTSREGSPPPLLVVSYSPPGVLNDHLR